MARRGVSLSHRGPKGDDGTAHLRAADEEVEVIVKVPAIDVVPREFKFVLIPKSVDQEPDEEAEARADGHAREAVQQRAQHAHEAALRRRHVQPAPLHPRSGDGRKAQRTNTRTHRLCQLQLSFLQGGESSKGGGRGGGKGREKTWGRCGDGDGDAIFFQKKKQVARQRASGASPL